MAHVRQFYFKATLYNRDDQCEQYETGFVAAETAGDAYNYCEEYYGSDFVGAYIEYAADCAIMLVDETICRDIMEDQF